MSGYDGFDALISALYNWYRETNRNNGEADSDQPITGMAAFDSGLIGRLRSDDSALIVIERSGAEQATDSAKKLSIDALNSLCRALKSNTQLTALHLTYSLIDDAGMYARVLASVIAISD